MSVVFRKLPFFDESTTVVVRDRSLRVKPNQIIVWVSLAPIAWQRLEPNVPRFPAILDTGYSHNFAIREDDLVQWAGLHPRFAPEVGTARINGIPVKLLEGQVWLHANRPGHRDVRPDRDPVRLELSRGIAIYPRGTPGAPRLPVLGLGALRQANLQLWLDCRKCHVYLSISRWFWFLW